MEIVLCDDREKTSWDHYVHTHERGTFYHSFGWRNVIKSAYGYESFYLAAKSNASIIGVLPLIYVRSPLLGSALISTAFTIGGGPIGNSEQVVIKLSEAAQEIAEEKNDIKYIEIRNAGVDLPEWQQKSDIYANFKLAIPLCEEMHLRQIRRQRRAAIRKAIASADQGLLNLRLNGSPREFYDIYSLSVRNHGTPVFPYRYLQALLAEFEDNIEISILDIDGKPSGALLSFFFKNSYLPYYVGSCRRARDLHANEYHYWRLMRMCRERGFEYFDFGRSKINSGPYQFKKLWGGEPEKIKYQYKLIQAKSVPNVNPNNPKFSYFAKAWRYLPIPIANRLGPWLARNFP